MFESQVAGKITIPRASISELRRSSAPTSNSPPFTPQPVNTNEPLVSSLSTLNTPLSTNSWLPPVIGHDTADWLQFKSGEWLRGRLKYIQNKRVEFESDQLEEQNFKLKDVRQLYPSDPMYAKFGGREPAYGNVVLSNGVLSISGPEQLTLPVSEMTGLTPSGQLGIRDWSGQLNVGLAVQSGNNSLLTLATSGELARRTPNTVLLFEYNGNYSEVNSSVNADSQRLNVTYDVRIDHHWFIRPIQFEYYYDPIANVSYRITGGVGAGYYFFDTYDLQWYVAAGPGFQYTRFDTVETGEPDSASTPAGVLQTKFKLDVTSRLTLKQNFTATFTEEEAGLFTHHSVSTLEFKIKHHLDLDVSFIWDYLENPRVQSDGSVPKKSDYYLTVGMGMRF